MILCLLFASMRQPIAVLASIPFGIIGVVLGHLLTGYNLTFLSLVGFIALSGIVVNDSLVLIDFINKGRERGMSARDAVMAGCEKRFRPIFLTTATTVTGLAPMAIGLSGYSTVFSPFAASIVFGLAVASLLTLYVVPMLYLALDDAEVRFAAWRGRAGSVS